MKRIILFFTVCLGLSVSQTTFADNADTARIASKRGNAVTALNNQTSNRSVATNTKRPDSTQNSSKNARNATKNQQRVVSRVTGVKPRNITTIKIPSEKEERISATSRAASSRAVSARQTESKQKVLPFSVVNARTATTQTKPTRVSRVAELNNEKINNIKSLDYSKCKTVYYECMDEFCANKDTNLRRCACSSRIHEFDGIKKQLSDAEDKMLDFNQRLLTVNLDKEDAAAINVATEGELAFDKKDSTESEKLLQKITKTLNSSGDSKINNNLSSISLSLDIDSAWDNVDSMSGIATSSKTGVELYNAARPICIEMAREVCNDEELDITQNSYKLTIQQDCDTVAKSYKTKYNSAMEKIHESAALLDMSRLNIHQQRNSDDTLTCKKKILTQLSDASVCGENLYKCLDTTGKYIDPSTGSAFLSKELHNLTNLLQEPGAGETWSKISQNEKFVNFLNSKKEFFKPAIEQCQDMSDTIWKEFLDDALSQIKLAQNAKLEEIKQSCTTLVTECKTTSMKSLSDFDARALSTFGVLADKTANAMCSDILESCSALMNANGITTDWKEGMTGIVADASYQNLIDTCTNIGRNCIVQQCNGTSGSFALCQKVSDDNRRAILNRTACWDKVVECIKDADNLESISIENRTNFYQSKYGITSAPEYCTGLSGNDRIACLIAEQIWGNCEYKPNEFAGITTNENLSTNNATYGSSNKILIPNTGSSLLSWFATNTGTSSNADSCNSNGCDINFALNGNTCQQLYTDSNKKKTTDCGIPTRNKQIINVTSNTTNYCASAVLDVYGNCCSTGKSSNGICVPSNWQAARLQDLTCTDTDSYLCPVKGTKLVLYCVTPSTESRPITYYSDYAEYACGTSGDNSMWVIVDEYGNYFRADQNTSGSKPTMYYHKGYDDATLQGQCTLDTKTCKRTYSSTSWTWEGSENGACLDTIGNLPTDNEFIIKYENIN